MDVSVEHDGDASLRAAYGLAPGLSGDGGPLCAASAVKGDGHLPPGAEFGIDNRLGVSDRVPGEDRGREL